MPMSPRLLRPRAAAATGTSAPLFPDIGGWWDATDASSYTLQTGVSEWRDKSGQGQAFRQTNTTNQPTINATGIGGKPALQFNGSNRWLDLGSQTIGGNNLLTPANNPWSIYLVCKSDQANALVRTLFGKGNSQIQLGQITTSYLSSVNGGGVAITAPAASLPANVDGVFGFEWNGSRARGFFNQNTGTNTLPAGTVEATNIALGVRNLASPIQPWSGFIGEVVFYNRVLSLGEQGSLSNYFNSKWGVSLPVYSPPAYADAAVNDYITAVEAVDGQALETGTRDAINAFITGCKTDNIWSAIKASCILMGARTLSGALTPLVGTAPTNVNFVSGDYNRKTGLLGDGSTKHINSNRKNNADPQDSQHFAAYLSAIPTGLGVLVGAGGGGTGASSVQRSGDATAGARSRNATYVTSGVNSAAFAAGLWGKSRTGSSTLTIRIANTDNTLPSPSSVASQTPSSDDIFVFARNNGSGAAEFRANARMAYYSIGEGLNLDTLGARLTTLYNAIGAAIP